MSQKHIETLRSGMDAFNRRDFEAALQIVADDVTWEPYLSRAETSEPLRGKAQVRAAWESQVEAVDLHGEPIEFIPVGSDKVVVPSRMVAHGSGSDVSLVTTIAWVWTFDDAGLVSGVELFDSREDALEALGRRG